MLGYANNETVKITSSSGIYKAMYHNGSFTFVFIIIVNYYC